jgi:two-component system, chemotaxis family, chemotaxis protein CheY
MSRIGVEMSAGMIRKILIADDSPIARKILKSCLPKDADYELHEVGDGLAAVQKYQEIRPDLTFMDLTMPVMDGLNAIAKIKEYDQKALIVVFTADIQKRTMEKVIDLEAFMMLKKPPSKEAVDSALARVEKYLKESR